MTSIVAGKNTFLKGTHTTRKAQMVETIGFNYQEWRVLNKLIGVKIPWKMMRQINHRISMIAHWRSINLQSHIGLQDIKRSLLAFQALTPSEARQAIYDIDASSIAYIDYYIWQQYQSLSESVSGEILIEAAQSALKNLPASSGGKPIQSHNEEIAELVIAVWRELGASGKAWSSEMGDSNLVLFAKYFFEKVNGYSDSSRIAHLLRPLLKNS